MYDKAKEVLDSDPDKYILFVLQAIARGSKYKLPDALKAGFNENKLETGLFRLIVLWQ